jgi:hypothetical protein
LWRFVASLWVEMTYPHTGLCAPRPNSCCLGVRADENLHRHNRADRRLPHRLDPVRAGDRVLVLCGVLSNPVLPMTDTVTNAQHHLKSEYEDAISQQAVELAIADDVNYYFLSEAQQKEYDDRARKSLREYLASCGMV